MEMETGFILYRTPHEGVSGKTEVISILVGPQSAKLREKAGHLAIQHHTMEFNEGLLPEWTTGDRGMEIICHSKQKVRYNLSPVSVWLPIE